MRSYDVLIRNRRASLRPASSDAPDALLCADPATWGKLEADVKAGMTAFRRGRLSVRRNLHLGVGFLAATSGSREPGRLEFSELRTECGEMAMVAGGTGRPWSACTAWAAPRHPS